jgi:integrase
MARKPLYLLPRNGRYYARIIIPKPLRPFFDGKSELREPLGPDLRTAKAHLATAVAGLQQRVAVAERKASLASGKAVEAGRYPLPVDQIVLRNYNERLAFDEVIRNADHRYANVGIDDRLISFLGDGLAGRLDDTMLQRLVGDRIEHFKRLGNTTAVIGTSKWRTLASAMCMSELEAMGRVVERDEGDFTGKPEHPMLANAVLVEDGADIKEAEFNSTTFEAIISEQERLSALGLGGQSKAPSTLKKYRNVIADFEHFRRSRQAATVTLEETERFRDGLLEKGQDRKTVRDKIATIRSILNWGQSQSNGALFKDGMPLQYIKLPMSEVSDSENKTYTLDQAKAVLEAARLQEKPYFRWVPFILAYSGARVGEILQLEKADFFQVGEDWFYHIRVGNGRTTKTKQSRRVPVHKALVDEGLLQFVEAANSGPLFIYARAEQALRDWIREKVLKGDKENRPSPNHGFRHLFEDLRLGKFSVDAGLYITGRANPSSAALYGKSKAMLPALAEELNKFPVILPR